MRGRTCPSRDWRAGAPPPPPSPQVAEYKAWKRSTASCCNICNDPATQDVEHPCHNFAFMFPVVEKLVKTVLLAQRLRKAHYPRHYSDKGMRTVSLDDLIPSNGGLKRCAPPPPLSA